MCVILGLKCWQAAVGVVGTILWLAGCAVVILFLKGLGTGEVNEDE